jgi:hypothetical protein
MRRKIWLENLKGKEQSENLGADGDSIKIDLRETGCRSELD